MIKNLKNYLLFLLVFVVAAGCGSSKTTTTPAQLVDTVAPTITAKTPASGATNISINVAATVTFSEVMTASTINNTNISMKTQVGSVNVPGVVALSGNTATFTPSAPLTVNTVYVVTVTTGVKDAAGNAMAATQTWSFTTAASAPTLASIAITPATVSVGIGAAAQLTATGTYSDSSTANISSTATWTSSAPAVATVNTTGLVTGVAAGSATITAAIGGVSGTRVVTVTTVTLSSIAITPAAPSVPVAGTIQLTATGTHSDASTSNVTATATWTSSNNAVATVNSVGLVTGVAAGSATITAAIGGVSGTKVVTVTAPTLTGIAVTPVNPSVNVAGTVALTATGTFSSGPTQNITATVTWSSSAPSIASVNASGVVTGVAAGTATITAAKSGVSNTTVVTVSAAPVVTGTQTYHFFNSAPGLKAIDPASPAAAPISVTANAVDFTFAVNWMTPNVQNMTYTDMHLRGVIYASGGMLYYVSAQKGQTPTPVRFSNETGATNVCTMSTDTDASLSTTGVVYTLAGPDTVCWSADDVHKMVLLNASTATAPSVTPKMIEALTDLTTGNRAGYIALSGTNLVKCDVNFLNCTTLMTQVTRVELVAGKFLIINNGLYHYTYNAGTVTLSGSLLTLPQGSSLQSTLDGPDMFFVNTFNNTLYKVPSDGSTAASVMLTDATGISNVQTTTNKVVYASGAQQAQSVKSVSKAGGTAVTIAATGTLMFSNHNGRVAYWNMGFDPNTMSMSAKFSTVNDDGTGVIDVAGSMPAAFAIAPNGSFNVDTPNIEKYIVVDLTTKVLKAVDGLTGVVGVTIGTAPASFVSVQGFGIGSDVLMTAADGAGATEIFYANSNNANSLVRVTNTPSNNEMAVQ